MDYTENLKRTASAIKNSSLLAKEQREAMLQALPMISPEHISELYEVLYDYETKQNERKERIKTELESSLNELNNDISNSDLSEEEKGKAMTSATNISQYIVDIFKN